MTHPPSLPLTVLGIETSCDETAAAVVRLGADGRAQVLSSVVASQVAEHAPYGGVVPEIAARSHVEAIDAIVAQALAQAGLGVADLGGWRRRRGRPGRRGDGRPGVRQGPVAGARSAAGGGGTTWKATPCQRGLTADVPIRSCCCWSRAGTASCSTVAGVGACRRLGSTIDDAAGEAFDKIAKTLGPALSRRTGAGAVCRGNFYHSSKSRNSLDDNHLFPQLGAPADPVHCIAPR